MNRRLNWFDNTMDERAMATDVDVSIRPRKEWALLYKQKRLAKA